MEVMTSKERKIVPELIAIANKLTERQQERLIWIGQGILIGSEGKKNGKTKR